MVDVTIRTTLVIATAACMTLHHAPASAGPVPEAVRGTWSSETDCGPFSQRIVVTADTITAIVGDRPGNVRAILQIDSTGDAEGGFEWRVVKIISDGQALNVGDTIIARLMFNKLAFVGRTRAGRPLPAPEEPPMVRCAA